MDSGIEDAGADDVGPTDEPPLLEFEAAGVFGFGAPKNEVIEALVFVFLASERGRVEDFRFKDMVNLLIRKDSLIGLKVFRCKIEAMIEMIPRRGRVK